jgi:hypothetical protein
VTLPHDHRLPVRWSWPSRVIPLALPDAERNANAANAAGCLPPERDDNFSADHARKDWPKWREAMSPNIKRPKLHIRGRSLDEKLGCCQSHGSKHAHAQRDLR